MTHITFNLRAVQQRIAAAAETYGRDPDHIRLLAVSKQQPVEAIQEALACGQLDFGENYLQEALEKIAAGGRDAVWHYIGRLQANTTRDVATHFDWVHTVDRARVARRLDAQRDPERPLNVCLQVNLSADSSRAGVLPAQLRELAELVHELPALRLRGLMTLPPAETAFERQRGHFRRLARMARELREAGLPADELSMGMSGDLEAAVAEGATWVRIGTAVFGERAPHGYASAATTPGQQS